VRDTPRFQASHVGPRNIPAKELKPPEQDGNVTRAYRNLLFFFFYRPAARIDEPVDETADRVRKRTFDVCLNDVSVLTVTRILRGRCGTGFYVGAETGRRRMGS
jgi:hypothetical protein